MPIVEPTDHEVRLVKLLADVWCAYMELPTEHPMERKEFCSAIHTCQDMVLARSGRRYMNMASED